MPTDRMLSHTVTLFNHAGENTDGEAQYLPTVIRSVYARMSRGITVGRGDASATLTPQDELIVYVFDQNAKAASVGGDTKTYLPSPVWDESQDKSSHWTAHDNGSDLLVIGTPTPTGTGAPPNEAQAYAMTKIIRREGGSPRMWHWEVHCA